MFNIITPTYNRRRLISRVFDSLSNQTYQNFKWIIVDDASTDLTEELINKWKQNSNLNIEYYLLSENKGKPNAVNFGLTKCFEKYTIIADSDDTFSNNTLENLLNIWQTIEKNNQQNICAIWSLVINEDNQIKGDKFPEDRWQVSFEERVLNRKVQLQGDKWHCWVTDILKKHPLYTDPHCHIGESHTWNEINKKHDFLCVNTFFLKAHVTENSLITSKQSRKNGARGIYFSSYYALKDVKLSDILKYKYYRSLAFQYVKAKFYFSDSKLKLSYSKLILSWIIFIFAFPERVINKFI